MEKAVQMTIFGVYNLRKKVKPKKRKNMTMVLMVSYTYEIKKFQNFLYFIYDSLLAVHNLYYKNQFVKWLLHKEYSQLLFFSKAANIGKKSMS